jgi:acetyl-CoA C-acetyltransferase
MQTAISLIGHGQTRFGEWWDKSVRDLAEEAVDKAIAASPCTALDIDLIVVANMLGEAANDQAHLGSLVASLLPHRPPAIRVESACASGSLALHTACAFLESGRAQTVLVVGVEKMTDVSNEAIAEGLMGAADAELDRPSGITFPGLFGLVASRYMHDYRLSREDLSLVSAVHHRNAVENPFAQFRSAVTPEAVTKSPLVADPLRLLDCSPISDGAAACILSTAFPGDVRIAASQIATDALSLTQRPSLTSFPATIEAMEKALAEAEITRSDVQALETHDCFSIAAVINLEDLGFADPGKGIEIYRALHQGRPSPLAVNRSGGLKGCGHPVAATGIKQVIDVSKALVQSNNRWGMAHNFGGVAATCGVHIIENTNA